MNKFSRYRKSRLLVGLVALVAMSFLTSAPFERDPQSCGMISVTEKKKKNSLPV